MLGFYKQLTVAAYQMADVIAPGSEYNSQWEQATAPIRQDPADLQRDRRPELRRTAHGSGITDDLVGRPHRPAEGREDDAARLCHGPQGTPRRAELRLFGGTPKGNAADTGERLVVHSQLGRGPARFEGRIPSITDAYHVAMWSSRRASPRDFRTRCSRRWLRGGP